MLCSVVVDEKFLEGFKSSWYHDLIFTLPNRFYKTKTQVQGIINMERGKGDRFIRIGGQARAALLNSGEPCRAAAA